MEYLSLSTDEIARIEDAKLEKSAFKFVLEKIKQMTGTDADKADIKFLIENTESGFFSSEFRVLLSKWNEKSNSND